MDGHEYRALVDRCLRLESSQYALRYQLSELTLGSGPPSCFPGVWKMGRDPYRRVLELMGSAVFVSSSPSLQIVYWNPAAEALFGWKEYEVLGESEGLLVAREDYHHLQLLMDKLKTEQSWSGQFPLKKKTGEIIIVLMTKSPLYENEELSGFITVSNDASLLDLVGPKIVKPEGDQSNGLPRSLRVKFRQISGHSKPLIPPVPILSSVSKLASKVLPRKFGDTHECDKCSSGSNSEESENAEKTGLAAKFLEKLHIKGDRNQDKDGESFYASDSSSGENHKRTGSSSSYPAMASAPTMSNGCHECEHSQLRSPERKEASKLQHLHAAACIKEGVQEHKKDNGMQSSGESTGGHDGSSSKGDNDLSAIMDCEIRWEDLQLGEEIGQGFFAKVYHGMWKGSDVAVKVFVGNEYSETSLLNYKKEIDIMKRLRHPNVLLFMGAAYSHERVAIVTELLPRGSLFKTIHKDGIVLDIRRRLRMALDVARGMNYLHHRNPPIVHRDLKSSNLLVDRNWSVKVADFGLSRLQKATLLTTKSGRGTPQWMAPEVLRNEPSNEKCDVFSFGVILWELMTRSIPWNHLNPLQVVGVVGFMDRRLDIPEDIDTQISALICDCWNRDLDRRPSFEEILKRMIGLIRGISSPTTSTRGGDC